MLHFVAIASFSYGWFRALSLSAGEWAALSGALTGRSGCTSVPV